MAGTWLSLEVTLLRGHLEEFWPPPGRELVVGPTHTFEQLGEEIDRSFGRWDLAHLRQITLADGTVVTDSETAAELEDDVDGGSGEPVKIGPDIDKARVVDLVRVGDSFRYEFDLGDQWIHRCAVTGTVDPRELGVRPSRPSVTFGWGALPDQHGRRWAEDDGSATVPRRPAEPDPMLAPDWPHRAPTQRVSLEELRVATHRRDVDAIVAAVAGHDVVDLLQHVGSAWEVAVAADPTRAGPTTLEIVEALRARGAPGDRELAEDLLTLQHGTPPVGGWLPIDLEELSRELEGADDEESGLLDLTTGEVVPGFMTDPMMVGEDASVDVDEDPDRWLALDRLGSGEGWQDMADFAARVSLAGVREQLERAIEGRGAFRRFRDLVHREGLVEDWRAFSDERAMGRAREWLAGNGVRALPPGPFQP